MATCPLCHGHLTEGHRCPKRRIWVVLEIIACGIAGGLASLLLLAAFDPFRQATDLEIPAVIGGIIVAVGINRILRG
jgi:hypothetical protein